MSKEEILERFDGVSDDMLLQILFDWIQDVLTEYQKGERKLEQSDIKNAKINLFYILETCLELDGTLTPRK